MTPPTHKPGADTGLPKQFLVVSNNLSMRCTDALAGLTFVRETLEEMDHNAPLTGGMRDAIIALIRYNQDCVAALIEHADGSERTWHRGRRADDGNVSIPIIA